MGERCRNIALRFLLLTLKLYSSSNWRYNNPMYPCFIFALPSHSLHTFLRLNGRMPYPKSSSPKLTFYLNFECRLSFQVSTLSYLEGTTYAVCRCLYVKELFKFYHRVTNSVRFVPHSALLWMSVFLQGLSIMRCLTVKPFVKCSSFATLQRYRNLFDKS